MVYLYLKLLYIIFAVLFLGNITVGVFWKYFAHKSKDPERIAFTFNGLIKADKYFTMPGVFGIILFGVGGALHGGFNLISTGWIFWSIILFAVSGAAFMAKLVPLQKKIAALASDKANFNWDEYQALAKQWDFWGFIALITPYLAVILMVIKPAL